jgi:hypothetical protein
MSIPSRQSSAGHRAIEKRDGNWGTLDP